MLKKFDVKYAKPIKTIVLTNGHFSLDEIVKLRAKVYRSINSCSIFVHLGPNMLVCACICKTLSHTMSLSIGGD